MTTDETWRILPFETNSAAINMATDEAVLEHVAKKESPPTIRFYQWQPSAVSIGYFQSLVQEVNQSECVLRGIEIVRRSTGGGAVFHDSAGEITYSLIAPENLFPKGITESYREICGRLAQVLQNIGVNAEFKPINDILVDGKKISGNAQTRKNGVLLQHGTILFDPDIATMFSVLNVGKEKISDKFIQSANQRVTRLVSHTDRPRSEIMAAIEHALLCGAPSKTTPLSLSERKKTLALAGQKYGSFQWTALR